MTMMLFIFRALPLYAFCFFVPEQRSRRLRRQVFEPITPSRLMAITADTPLHIFTIAVTGYFSIFSFADIAITEGHFLRCHYFLSLLSSIRHITTRLPLPVFAATRRRLLIRHYATDCYYVSFRRRLLRHFDAHATCALLSFVLRSC
jgi:hypothetical protein